MTTELKALPKPVKRNSLVLLVVLTILSLYFWDDPTFSWLMAPVKILVTTLHELGHALICLITGGSVSGLTIVNDNSGHGGLTMCRGGNPFLYTQSGYLGTAVFGCLFIFLGRDQRLSKGVLLFLGGLIAIADILFMTGAIFHEGRIIEGVLSISWGLALAGLLVWAGLKLPPTWANLLLLFLAVQTALNALTDVAYLFKTSVVVLPGAAFSDATTMEQMTHLPAWLWSGLWGISSVVMLAATLWVCYGVKRKA